MIPRPLFVLTVSIMLNNPDTRASADLSDDTGITPVVVVVPAEQAMDNKLHRWQRSLEDRDRVERSSSEEGKGEFEGDAHDWLNTAFLWAREGSEMALFAGAYSLKYPEHRGKIMLASSVSAVATTAAVIGVGTGLEAGGVDIPDSVLAYIESVTYGFAAWVFFRWGCALCHRMYGASSEQGAALSKLQTVTIVLLPVAGYSMREATEGSVGTLKMLASGHYEALTLPLIAAGILTATLTFLNRDKIPYINKIPCPTCKVQQTVLIAGALITLNILGAGMVSNGIHEVEEITVESPVLWDVSNKTVVNGYDIWSEDRFPMVIFSLGGYRAKATVTTLLGWFGYISTVGTIEMMLICLARSAARAGQSDIEAMHLQPNTSL